MENIKLVETETISCKIRNILDSHQGELEFLHSKCHDKFSEKVVLGTLKKLEKLRKQFLACNVEYENGIPYFLKTSIIYPYIDLASEVYHVSNYKCYSNCYDIEDFEIDFSNYLSEQLSIKLPYIRDRDGIIKYVKLSKIEELV